MSEYAVGIKLDHIGGMVLPKKPRLWKKSNGVSYPEIVHNGTNSDPFGTMPWAKGAQNLIIFALPLPPPQLLLLLLLLVVLSVFVQVGQ